MVTFSFLNWVISGPEMRVWDRKENRKMMLSLECACMVLRDHYGVHFPTERVPGTNGKYKPGPQDKGKDL